VAFVPSRFQVVDVVPEKVRGSEDDLARAATELRSSDIDALVQVGTPFGFIDGADGDRALAERLTQAAGVPAVTMMTAVVEALHHLGIHRPAILTPYVDSLDALLAARLVADSIEPAAMVGLGEISNLAINSTPSQVAYRLAKKLWKETSDADGLFISSGGLATFDIIEILESDTGLPVVSSNSAGLWAGLRLVDVAPLIPGLGVLFAPGRNEGKSAPAGAQDR
jgi:arylmalonate decarboxylase